MTMTTRATSPEKNREREEKQKTIFQHVEQETEQARTTTTKANSRTPKKLFKKRKNPSSSSRPLSVSGARAAISTVGTQAQKAVARAPREEKVHPRDLLFPFGAVFRFFSSLPRRRDRRGAALPRLPLPPTHIFFFIIIIFFLFYTYTFRSLEQHN